MREQAMRYCLIALIVALAGMYVLAFHTPYPGFLPPATPAEVQAWGVFANRHSAAETQPSRPQQLNACADTPANVHPADAPAELTAHAYTSCDAPIAAGAADFDSDF
jgi:hypothetical protein